MLRVEGFQINTPFTHRHWFKHFNFKTPIKIPANAISQHMQIQSVGAARRVLWHRWSFIPAKKMASPKVPYSNWGIVPNGVIYNCMCPVHNGTKPIVLLIKNRLLRQISLTCLTQLI